MNKETQFSINDLNKIYLYNELDFDFPLQIDGRQILDLYWPIWSGNMVRLNKPVEQITYRNCIEDWLVFNWAWEKK